MNRLEKDLHIIFYNFILNNIDKLHNSLPRDLCNKSSEIIQDNLMLITRDGCRRNGRYEN